MNAIFIDFAKAFDVVPHYLLLLKLSQLNIISHVIGSILKFLSYRKQSVFIDDTLFSPVMLNSGVSQGSVLGPPLFFI